MKKMKLIYKLRDVVEEKFVRTTVRQIKTNTMAGERIVGGFKIMNIPVHMKRELLVNEKKLINV